MILVGTVDSLTTVVSASYLNKHIEAVKYFTNLREYFQIVLPVIGKKSWNKLNAKQKKILHQAANEAGEAITAMIKNGGTGYLRLDKTGAKDCFSEDPFVIGKSRRYKESLH